MESHQFSGETRVLTIGFIIIMVKMTSFSPVKNPGFPKPGF
jgi:hypothetical protein